jgi:hypothetical protein
MSHFTRVRTTLRDPGLLTAALAEVGYRQVEVHEQPEALYGYQGDARPQRAEIVIRRRHVGGSSNDIGFARQPDGTFEAIISEFDRRRHDQQWLDRLARAYGHAAALKFAADNGYEVQADTAERDGTRRITLRRYALNTP